VWAPSYFVFQDVNLWQLIINTATTIVTFLLVALLQNVQDRENKATQHKLNAIADALAEQMCAGVDAGGPGAGRLGEAVRELRAAVGVEERESA
jgi:low affinity Fe/Cu permease